MADLGHAGDVIAGLPGRLAANRSQGASPIKTIGVCLNTAENARGPLITDMDKTRTSMVGSPPSARDIEEMRFASAEVTRLRRHVAKYRDKVVLVFGADAPESASLLIYALAQMNDPTSRSGLYQGAVTECLLRGYQSAAERIAVAAHEEFQDIFSLMSLSQTLMDVGKPSEGLAHAKAALAQAMSEQVLLNYAAGHLMRQAVKTGSTELVNEALDALVDSTQVSRTSDCALETDWIEEAEALGADKVLTDWVRAVAKQRGFRPRGER